MSDIIPTYSLQTFTVEDFQLGAPYIHPTGVEGSIRCAHVELESDEGTALVRLTQYADKVTLTFLNTVPVELNQLRTLTEEAFYLESAPQDKKHPLAASTAFEGEN